LHHHYLYSYVKPLVKLLKRLLDFKPLLFIPRQALYIAAEKKINYDATPAKKRTSCFSGLVCADQGTRSSLRSPRALAPRPNQFSLVLPASASGKLEKSWTRVLRLGDEQARGRALILLLRVLACLQPPC